LEAQLTRVFSARVGTMREIGIAHEDLQVSVIRLSAHQGHITGVLLTPWCMNLIRLAGDLPLPDAAEGSTIVHAYPAGEIAFTVGHAPEIGRLDAASLFSPMFEFADQAAAVATAEAILDELFRQPEAARPERPDVVPSRRALLFGRGSAQRGERP
jgi:[NiFe] hydrogenase assembly HybE family chaperone